MEVEKIELAPGFQISRIVKGGWQLSQGHSHGANNDPIEDMFAFAEAGITTFDCADIYTGVEELIGKFLAERKRRLGSSSDIKVLTKFVPDYDDLASISKSYVEKIINRSLKRLGQERLDMVQFSWWTYDIPGWVETAHWLKELQQAGKINLISATNFNTASTKEIVSAGVKLSTLQVQYSLLDNRPEKSLISLCEEERMHLLCYGTVAGGFFSKQWLGVSEPKAPFENRSLVKYKLMIDEFGGWELFQRLLNALNIIAFKHNVDLTNVASRYILDRKSVGGIIIGARTIAHLKSNLKIFSFQLDESDMNLIEGVLSQRKGPPGDVFDIERIKEGPHGSIMKYNLNQQQV
ncbi:MAG: aldo/keto reductase [Cyclobacteriaceae bacterium]|nr:aldo/keto reductase [Cyclobacteriaceae bacterium]